MPKYTPTLTTLESFKRSQGVDSTNSNDEVLILDYIRAASTYIAEQTDRTFVPYYATRSFDARGSHINGRTLDVDEDLLAIGTLTNGDSAALTASQYRLEDPNFDPKWRIKLKSDSSAVFTYNTAWEDAISVEGWWGFHDRYASAFKTLTTLNGTLNISETTLPAADSTVFETLHYLRIDDEMMQITSLLSGIEIERGVQGTDAAAHASGADVEIYQELPDIQLAADRLAQFLYQRRDALGLRVQFADGASVLEGEIPPELEKIIRDRSRKVANVAR